MLLNPPLQGVAGIPPRMCGKKGARGEGARERHDAASPNQVLQRGDATREGRRDRGDT
jgi:hypothetical protein